MSIPSLSLDKLLELPFVRFVSTQDPDTNETYEITDDPIRSSFSSEFVIDMMSMHGLDACDELKQMLQYESGASILTTIKKLYTTYAIPSSTTSICESNEQLLTAVSDFIASTNTNKPKFIFGSPVVIALLQMQLGTQDFVSAISNNHDFGATYSTHKEITLVNDTFAAKDYLLAVYDQPGFKISLNPIIHTSQAIVDNGTNLVLATPPLKITPTGNCNSNLVLIKTQETPK